MPLIGLPQKRWRKESEGLSTPLFLFSTEGPIEEHRRAYFRLRKLNHCEGAYRKIRPRVETQALERPEEEGRL